MNEVRNSAELKEKFAELGIDEIEIRRTIEEIIEKPPILAIPIDHIPADLKDWASVIKNEVKLLEIEKYLDDETQETIYRIPEYLPIPQAEIEEGEGKMKITRDEFLARCEEPARILFSELEEIATKKNNIVKLEPRTTSFSFKIKIGTKEMVLLTIYPNSVYIMKSNLTPEKGFKPEIIEAFVKKIKKISPLSDRYDTMTQPGFSTKASDISVDDIKTFADAIKELVDSSI